ncbi:hypothetical protein IG631_24157 [Alternaria alternata]|nr:hypothetical protein IG631_24157 [Alternaria alternata]
MGGVYLRAASAHPGHPRAGAPGEHRPGDAVLLRRDRRPCAHDVPQLRRPSYQPTSHNGEQGTGQRASKAVGRRDSQAGGAAQGPDATQHTVERGDWARDGDRLRASRDGAADRTRCYLGQPQKEEAGRKLGQASAKKAFCMHTGDTAGDI